MKTLHYLAAALLLVSTSAHSGQIRTKDEASKLAIAAIQKYHLTALKDDCGSIDVIDQPLYFEIVVRERHTQKCGGLPETGPRLFNLRVRKKDGQLTSDVYDGTTYKLVNHKPVRTK